MALKFEIIDFTDAIRDSEKVITNLTRLGDIIERVRANDGKATEEMSRKAGMAARDIEKLAGSSSELLKILKAGNIDITRFAALNGELGQEAQRAVQNIENQAAAYRLLRTELVGRLENLQRLENQLKHLSTEEGKRSVQIAKQIREQKKLIEAESLSADQIKKLQDDRVKAAMAAADGSAKR